MVKKVKFKKIGPVKLPCLLKNRSTGNFRVYLYRFPGKKDYFVVEKGDVRNIDQPLIRIHSHCGFGVILNSRRCECRFQLEESMLKIWKSKGGLVIYAFSQEGRGSDRWSYVRAYIEEDKGVDSVIAYQMQGLPPDQRDYRDAAAIIKDYGFHKIKLLTNNPSKVSQVERYGIKVKRIPLIGRTDKYNIDELKTKAEKLGHHIDKKHYSK